MPAPFVTYAGLRDLLHMAEVGSTVRGFQLEKRTVLNEGRGLFELTVTRNGNTWTCVYMAAPDGTVGRILRVVDQDGQQYAPEPWRDGWRNTSIIVAREG